MADAPAQAKALRVADLFDRDLTADEIEQIRQKIDTLAVRSIIPAGAAHHHDVTPLA